MDLKVLHKISYGLYVVSSAIGDRFNGQIANTVFQITSEPPTLAVSINKVNLTHEFIKKSGLFVVNILDINTEMIFIGRFGFKSGRDIDKFDGVKYHKSRRGIPILEENSIGFMEVVLNKDLDVGTHTVFIGDVIDGDIITEGEPLTYAHYHLVKRGKAPKTAPTYIKE
ncbi:MAG: flavin reductase family protein [Thermodesulfobacteriota bacterium]|nr:flavin reductase family protein [Thermodesulfobacteriota bacterium]